MKATLPAPSKFWPASETALAVALFEALGVQGDLAALHALGLLKPWGKGPGSELWQELHEGNVAKCRRRLARAMERVRQCRMKALLSRLEPLRVVPAASVAEHNRRFVVEPPPLLEAPPRLQVELFPSLPPSVRPERVLARQDLHQATEPAQREDLHQATEPAHREDLHQATEPAHREDLHEATEPVQREDLHQATEPAHREDLHQATEPVQREDLHQATEPAHREDLHQATEPAQPDVLGVCEECMGDALNPSWCLVRCAWLCAAHHGHCPAAEEEARSRQLTDAPPPELPTDAQAPAPSCEEEVLDAADLVELEEAPPPLPRPRLQVLGHHRTLGVQVRPTRALLEGAS
jgi:hypothetical protein